MSDSNDEMDAEDRPVARRGRPSAYRPEFVAQAAKLAKLGATDADLADFFEVSVVTIWSWKTRHGDFLSALKAGKDEADDRVERSLYARATGYTFDSLKIFCTKDGEVIEHEFKAHVPPDVVACIFWLKNRRPAEWRDKHEVDLSGSLSLKQIDSSMSPREAAEQYALTLRDVTPARAPE